MALLFIVTLLLSAFLLFWVQPLVGKLLLPLLGGTPAVWNTCMLFFQGMLLAGYAYVHALTRWLRQSRQVVVHAALLALAAFFFPIGVSEATARGVPEGDSPALWLLGRLFLMVGLPFFAVSTSAPLLQKWFSKTGHESADDPYFLYAASNMGSFLALLGFPLLVEPNWTLGAQGKYWAWGYGALALLILACAFASRRGDNSTTIDDSAAVKNDVGEADEVGGVPWRRRLRWTLLAFVPSSLVLGVTTYITTDVAAVPLLWVIPLSIYLLSFVLVFAKRQVIPWRWMAMILPGTALLLALVYLSGATEPVWFLVLIHLLFLFVASMVCHGQLAEERPDAVHLAEFYLWVAVGGVLGGVFNALVAPLVFNTIAEYPLAVILACALRPAPSRRTLVITRRGISVKEKTDEKPVDERAARWRDLVMPLALFAFVALLVVYVPRLSLKPIEDTALMVGVPLLLLNHFFARRPARFALGLGAVMLAVGLFSGLRARTLHAERNFYGTLRVVEDSTRNMRRLLHGSTLHGRQFLDPGQRCEPLSYYHREGPLGAVIETFEAKPDAAPAVAVVGLGVGASVGYSRAGERWTFYEIDPAVDAIARDRNYFTYLSDCAQAPAETVLGDARLKLRDAPDSHYGLIILDAFSSDAIPAHLLTREALRLYLSKLAPGGLIAFHVSNRALNLDSVVGGLARDAGLEARVFNDTDYQPDIGKEPSHWAVLARKHEDLGALAADTRFASLDESKHDFELWSDDFSDIISVFKWF